jgi:hypothetical protein
VLEKAGADQLNRSCEKWRCTTWNQAANNIIHTINGRKANWIGHSTLRNCLLKRVIEGKIEGRIEVTGKRGRIICSYGTSLRKREGIAN